MGAEPALLSSPEVQRMSLKLLSADSDAKISIASINSIQRCRLVYHHVVMVVQYTVLNRNLICWRSIYNLVILNLGYLLNIVFYTLKQLMVSR